MFTEIFIFELKLWLKRPGIYIYFLVFVALAFLLGAAVGGMFGGVSTDTNTHINSAVMIADLFTSFNSDYLFGLITLLIGIAVMAPAVQKDFQHATFSFYFTKPVSKFSYLFGRFFAAFLLTALVLTGIMLGMYLAFLLSPNDNGQLGDFRLLNFLVPYLVFLLPNLFFAGSLFFCVVTFSRNMVSGYVGGLVFIIVAGISNTIVDDIDRKALAALLDPFGSKALDLMTDYWTPAESNTRMVPLGGHVLYNRLLWTALSVVLLCFTYYRFSFSQFLNPTRLFRRAARSASPAGQIAYTIGRLPKVMQRFDLRAARAQLALCFRFELGRLVRSVFFYIILGLSVLLTIVTSNYSNLLYGTSVYRLTYIQIGFAGGTFAFFQLVMLVFYSGVTIWRERDSRVDELSGSTPTANGVFFFAKFLALLVLALGLNVVCIVTCIALQTYQGYTHYELGLYFTDLILMRLPGLSALLALALSIQIFLRNRYFAFFLVAFVVMGLPLVLRAFKYSNDLLVFNSSGPQLPYSDMNGHGHTLVNYVVYKGYWVGAMLALAALALAMYPRGRETSFLIRLKQAFRNFTPVQSVMATTGLVLMLACGTLVYYNTRVLNPYVSPKEQEQRQARFEEQYKAYEREPQPRVVESNLEVDIYPSELRCELRGFFYLKNKNSVAVKQLFLNVPPEAKIRSLRLLPGNRQFIRDTVAGFYGYRLSRDLAPGDSMKLEFDLVYAEKQLLLHSDQTQIVKNGSFFNSQLLPAIGYNAQAELEDNSARKKYGLTPKPRMASILDTSAYKNNYISNDADWIRFQCRVSTDEDQIALAPGYLQREWTEHGRRYFSYKMDAPILNFYAFLSARYMVRKDQWQPAKGGQKVDIGIYYTPGHTYNLDRMVKGIKKSLDYFTTHFSPYQHRQVRIIEFPRYATFAQSFPNTIPFSESIGFIARVNDDDPQEVDYPFYVTAHEVAHQWWAHQVIGANVQGSTLMSETMAQYSALMVMEKEYGQAAMSKFLKYEMDRYLNGRAAEGKKEVPLLFCENQQYIHYNKGSMVMYALKDYLGEDTLNAALARYIKKTAFSEPPYTTALEFYDFILRATPDSLRTTVQDLFEKIVVYDNSMKSWSYKKKPNGRYAITMMVGCEKTSSDSLGKGREVKPADWIDIGVFFKEGDDGSRQAGFLKKFKITGSPQVIELETDNEPLRVGIDPYYKLIDTDTGNNIMDASGRQAGAEANSGASIQVSSD